ncbi:MAG: hypothetical protein M3O30_05695 [Planctomycetota bacterium]|nr:hypothetical protein [Planctomycetota bacterium]
MSYDPSIGRWMEEDRAGYVDGPNMYQMEESNPVDSLDPTGLWDTVSFNGVNATDQQRIRNALSSISDRLSVLWPQAEAALILVKSARTHASKNCCSALSDKLEKQLAALSDVLRKDAADNNKNIIDHSIEFTDRNFGPDKVGTKASTRWSMGGYGTTGEVGLNSGANPNPWQSMSQADLEQLLFHEMTHLYGTDDGEAGDDFNNAHMVEGLTHRDLDHQVWFQVPIQQLIDCYKKNNENGAAQMLAPLLGK